MRHEAKPPMAPRKIDTSQNPDNIDEIVAAKTKADKDAYMVRVNKSTIVLKTNKRK